MRPKSEHHYEVDSVYDCDGERDKEMERPMTHLGKLRRRDRSEQSSSA
jgi:hypothetical protein